MTKREIVTLKNLYAEYKNKADYWWNRYDADKDETSLRAADQAQGALYAIENVLAHLKITNS